MTSNKDWAPPNLNVFISYTYYQTVMDNWWSGRIHDVALQVDPSADVENAGKKIKALFEQKYGRSGQFSVDSDSTLIAEMKKFLNIFSVLLTAIALLSLVVGGIGINNMMLVCSDRNASILPGYFNTIGAQLIEGRDFTDADDPAHRDVAVIDDVLARQLWPGKDPLGRRLNISDSPKGPYQFERDWVVVVGVVRHVQCHTLTAIVRPQVYLPYPLAPRPSMSIVMRSAGGASNLAALVRTRVSSLNRNIPITHVEPLSAVVERARAESRFVSLLATLLSIVALQLALGGIFGVLSYSVVVQTTEIGIRMALGASRLRIMRMVFGEGLLSVTAGIVAGVILSVVSMPLLAHLLFEISPGSPQNYGLITLAILLLSAIAMTVPALRAISVEPVTALAAE